MKVGAHFNVGNKTIWMIACNLINKILEIGHGQK
jgi:hypothetical protein